MSMAGDISWNGGNTNFVNDSKIVDDTLLNRKLSKNCLKLLKKSTLGESFGYDVKWTRETLETLRSATWAWTMMYFKISLCEEITVYWLPRLILVTYFMTAKTLQFS